MTELERRIKQLSKKATVAMDEAENEYGYSDFANEGIVYHYAGYLAEEFDLDIEKAYNLIMGIE